jgi:Fe2+ or Zn2+ uptake regulation protein
MADGRIDAAMRRGSAEAGFALERPTVEALGLCPDCQSGAKAAHA